MNLPAAELRGIYLPSKTNSFADSVTFYILFRFLDFLNICLLYLHYQTYLQYLQKIHLTKILYPIVNFLLPDVFQIFFLQLYFLLFLLFLSYYIFELAVLENAHDRCLFLS